MKHSRQDTLRQKFNMFNHVLGETLEGQLQRFITLTTKMSSAGISVPRSEVNKKLLNSLPKTSDMNVPVIKKIKDLNRLSLAKIMAFIKACDLDDKDREINHINSYSSANLGIQSNNAFSSFTNPQVQPFPAPHSSFAAPQS
mgnify:CR=1 FL=1